MNNLEELGYDQPVCGCSFGFYELLGQCFTCPSRCLSCNYYTESLSVECFSCQSDSFRSAASNCSCQEGFV